MATSTVAVSAAVFRGWTMVCSTYVALPIPRLVRVEMVERLLSVFRHRAYITVVRIIAIINVAVEAMRAVEPRASADEHPANEPIGPIVAIRSAGVRRIVKVPIRTHRRHANID
jgi:hypothetical protein